MQSLEVEAGKLARLGTSSSVQPNDCRMRAWNPYESPKARPGEPLPAPENMQGSKRRGKQVWFRVIGACLIAYGLYSSSWLGFYAINVFSFFTTGTPFQLFIVSGNQNRRFPCP